MELIKIRIFKLNRKCDKKAIINDCEDEILQFINDVKLTKNVQIFDINNDVEIN